MRTIYFASNFQNDLFPSNTRTKFESYIHSRDLNYISSGELEVAIKSVTFDFVLEGKVKKSPYILGLKTNLSYHTISSYGWDNIVSIFSLTPREKGILQFQFDNPTFFITSHQKLCKSEFDIIDLKTGKSPNFAVGSPTFIEVLVREQLKRMKAPFHILLDSSCKESLQRFPSNTNMDFTVQLPKRLEFQKDWSICVKSVHFSNTFVSLSRCFIKIRTGQFPNLRWAKEFSFTDRKKFPHDISKLLHALNKKCEGFLIFNYDELRSKVKIRCIMGFSYGDVLVAFSDELVKIFGLSENLVTFTLEKTVIESDFQSSISALHPLHFLICCDVVQESILGGQRVQVLKYFPRNFSKDDVIDQEFSHNDFVTLSLKSFDRIRIRIADLSGKTIQSDSDIPTRMQLLFLNINSA